MHEPVKEALVTLCKEVTELKKEVADLRSAFDDHERDYIHQTHFDY